MIHRQAVSVALLGLLSLPAYCAAWSNVSFQSSSLRTTKRSVLMMRRGRGSLGKEFGDGAPAGGGTELSDSGMGGSGGGVNWIPIRVSAKSLPTEENKVGIIDTNLPTMKIAQINPTGAVSVIKYNKQTYCFAINCPSCKIPLTKAQCLPGTPESSNQPRIVCDLCKATYNVKNGAKLQSDVSNAGFLGGIAKTVFSAKESGPLPVYKLGEKGGKLLIGLD
jgi:nitrite reductase/ring-hydroxylating ferredoxin subunit